MQKVEGSSPFIRSSKPAGNGGFSLLDWHLWACLAALVVTPKVTCRPQNSANSTAASRSASLPRHVSQRHLLAGCRTHRNVVVPTSLDNGLRSPRKLLRAVVARLLAGRKQSLAEVLACVKGGAGRTIGVCWLRG
jgi:hypothetical protein